MSFWGNHFMGTFTLFSGQWSSFAQSRQLHVGVVSGLGVAVLTSVFIPVSGGQVGYPGKVTMKATLIMINKMKETLVMINKMKATLITIKIPSALPRDLPCLHSPPQDLPDKGLVLQHHQDHQHHDHPKEQHHDHQHQHQDHVCQDCLATNK